MNKIRVLIAALVLFILVAAAMVSLDSMIITDVTPFGIISFQFIGTLEASVLAMNAWGDIGRSAVAVSLGLDYLFILAYSIIGCLVLILASQSQSLQSPVWGNVLFSLAYAFPIISIADAVENYSLIQLLLGSINDSWPTLAYFCASIKFTGLATVSFLVMLRPGYKMAKKFIRLS
jgi:hypothetical protein